MKTDELIAMLAKNAGPAPRGVVASRLGPAIVAGLSASCALSLWVMGALPAAAFLTPAPWFKLAYTGSLAIAAMLLAARLARPVGRISLHQTLVVAVVAAMALAGGIFLALTPPEARLAAVLGASWRVCPLLLMAFSLPALAAIFLAVRSLAPTKPRHAGFACGLLAGALGAMGYSLACPESSPTFVAIWYSAGIALTALAGWALGPRGLRW